MPLSEHDRELAATFQAITEQRPVYKELVDRFQELFRVQAELAREFEGLDFGLRAPDPERHGKGVSLLADAGLPHCPDQLRAARDKVLPVLERYFPFAEEIRALNRAAAAGSLDMRELAKACLESDLARIQERAKAVGVGFPVLFFALRAVLNPVLAGMARRYGPGLEECRWTQGYCPLCGSAPAIASLSKFNNEREESIVGGGGKKRLACSLCLHQWGFRRDACPACGNTDHDQRELLFVENLRHERIEACKECGAYLLCVDLREIQGRPRIEALPLGLVHLDLIARNKDYSPMAVLPWNMV